MVTLWPWVEVVDFVQSPQVVEELEYGLVVEAELEEGLTDELELE